MALMRPAAVRAALFFSGLVGWTLTGGLLLRAADAMLPNHPQIGIAVVAALWFGSGAVHIAAATLWSQLSEERAARARDAELARALLLDAERRVQAARLGADVAPFLEISDEEWRAP